MPAGIRSGLEAQRLSLRKIQHDVTITGITAKSRMGKGEINGEAFWRFIGGGYRTGPG